MYSPFLDEIADVLDERLRDGHISMRVIVRKKWTAPDQGQPKDVGDVFAPNASGPLQKIIHLSFGNHYIGLHR